MVKSISVVTRRSEKKDSLYSCLEFDLGYRKLKVFADSATYQTLTDKSPKEFSEMLVDAPFLLNFEEFKICKKHSAKTGADYFCLEFDLGYRVLNVFAERFDYLELADITPKQLFNITDSLIIKVGE